MRAMSRCSVMMAAHRAAAALMLLAASAVAAPAWARSSGSDAAADASSGENSSHEESTDDTGAPDAALQVPPWFGGSADSDRPQADDAPGDPALGQTPLWPNVPGGSTGGVPAPVGPEELYDRIATNSISMPGLTYLLVLFVIGIQQAGFSLYERGLASDQCAGPTWTRNLLIIPLGAGAFWAYGFAIGWGNWFNGPVPPGWYPALGPGLAVLNSGLGLGPDPANPGAFQYGLLGAKGFFLHGVDDVSVMSLFVMLLPFLMTAITIPGGAMSQRWSLKCAGVYCAWTVVPYCLFANWVWCGGWLAQAGLNWHLGHGVVDFAGSGVVHAMGGMIALAGCLVIGPRGRPDLPYEPPRPALRKTAALILGAIILAIFWGGWDLRSTPSANAIIAGHTGAIAALATAAVVRIKLAPATFCRGFLAGLVACSASCAFVDRLGAAAIGAVAGPITVLSLRYCQRRGIDDLTGAISVNGIAGLWGLIALGLFADGRTGDGWGGVVRSEWQQAAGIDGVRGLFYGDASQLTAQLLAAAVVVVFGFGTAYICFRISNRFVPLRKQADARLRTGSAEG